MSEANSALWYQLDLKCKPLDTLEDIHEFMLNPPAWRTLCEPLRPHSKYLIKNSEVNPNFEGITLEKPQSFCHFDLDADETPRHPEDQLPRTLLCHDMANGYHDDSAIDGTGDHNAYAFYYWSGVDIFCYFSHHLVTIPPLGWINVAHAHGVKVIGTIITEWTEGALFWNQVLSSEQQMQTVVSALVTIAKTLKFEGWLLNVENKVSAPERLVSFVAMFHRTLHAELPGALLIWYDSVINDGSLSWQNQLNHKNKQFFDVCDGFFTNYSWSEADVAASVAAAGARRRDLYVGVDVWGRNFYGGGQFNTQQALKLVHSYDCSVAIFAPAWTWEAMGGDEEPCDPHGVEGGGGLPRRRRLLLRERALWDSLWPFLRTRLPATLPFQTSFCMGHGTKRRMYGEVLCNSPWYNLRHMHYQPSWAHGAHCYLLSTAARLRSASRLAVRDVRGILKLRESLLDLSGPEQLDSVSRLIRNPSCEDLSTEPAYQSAYQLEDQSANQLADEQTANKPGEESPRPVDSAIVIAAQTSEDALNKPAKFKNVFKNILKLKKAKVEFKEPSPVSQEPPQRAEEPAEQPAAEPSLERLAPDLRLRLQDDKTRLTLAFVREERDCLEPYFEDSYSGGCCLRLHPSDDVSPQHRTQRLFHCDFPVRDALVVCLVTKALARAPQQALSLWLAARDAAQQRRRALLVGRRMPVASPAPSPGLVTRYPERPGSDEFKELQTYLLLHEPGFYMPLQNHYGWQVFYFVVPLAGCRVTWLGCRAADRRGPVLLGHVGLCEWRRPALASHSAPTLVSSREDYDEGPKNEWKEK
ncbi:uncharacterized protein LOC126368616 [Pectinophora gossypiella]|uniref:uncharacterized protein LOC126368616 n=1 Tax=Pectinophora gossypiella TaxID=13191 RepID=UPI00214E8F9C|nr:uncharacterized protein LOC126368616 [Pectinophora gossypiella]XP_049868633.1 uncharacterized protein LOC126368616 [Pectinophora gossypiella]